MTHTAPSPRAGLLVALVALTLLLVQRAWLLMSFGVKFTDLDQPTLWGAALDLSAGELHQPHFYGQAYASLLEALLAVPLLWVKVPPHVALPVVAAVCATVPFVLFGGLAAARGRHLVAVAVLALPLLLSLDFSMFTIMPRGIYPGLFLVSVGAAVACLQPATPVRQGLAALCIAVGLTQNPSAFMLAVPVVVFLAPHPRREPRLAMAWLIGAGPGVLILLAQRAFYSAHPDYILHKALFDFEPGKVLGRIAHPSVYLSGVSPPGLPVFLWMALAALLGLSVYLRSRRLGLAVGTALICFGAAHGFDKLDQLQGMKPTSPLHFPPWRLFLVMPTCLAFLLLAATAVGAEPPDAKAKAKATAKAAPRSQLPLLVAAGVLGALAVGQGLSVGPRLRALESGVCTEPRVCLPVSTVRAQCERLAQTAAAERLQLVVFDGVQPILTKACESFWSGPLRTLFPASERRVWRLAAETRLRRDGILLVSDDPSLCHRLEGIAACAPAPLDPRWFVVHPGGKTVPDLFHLARLRIQKNGLGGP